jgi:Ca2+-binding RTX toxin-like protein
MRTKTILLAGAIALAAPAGASAATLSATSPPGGFVYTAAPGEQNDLTVTYDEQDHLWRFKDKGASITVSLPDCAVDSAGAAQCHAPANPQRSDISVSLGNLDDSVDLREANRLSAEVDAGEGADVVYGLHGFALPGGTLNHLSGGPGADQINGSGSRDVLAGGEGSDLLIGLGGRDHLDGGTGGDVLQPGLGTHDVVIGGDGGDVVSYADRSTGVDISLDAAGGDGGPGEDDDIASDVETLVGTPGDDRLFAQYGNVDNELWGAGGNDALYGGSGKDHLIGSSGDDELLGDAGDDLLDGGDGADRLSGGFDSDDMDGGDGIDTATYADRLDPITVRLDDEAHDGGLGDDDFVRPSVENVEGGLGDDALTGGPGSNVLSGGTGADSLYAKDGAADTLECGVGVDLAEGDDDLDTRIGCELPEGAQPPVEQQQTPPPPAAAPSVKLKLVRVARAGAYFRVTCTGSRCAGSLTLKGKSKKKLGSKRFSIDPGSSTKVKIKLRSATRRRLAKKPLPVTVIAAVKGAAAPTEAKLRLRLR